MSQSPLRVLVVGTGSIGTRHAENLRALNVQVDQIGWRQSSVEDVASRLDAVDAAVIATATDVRLPLIEVCAAANIPVYVEKPLAFSLAQIATISDVAAPIASRSMLGYMMRYHPAFRILAGADLLDVFSFGLSIGSDVTQWRANWRFSQSYAARPDGGGVLLDLCHEIDMALCLVPDLAVQAVDSLGHVDFPGVDMASRIRLISAKGVAGAVAMDYLTPQLHRRTILHGSARMHDFDFAAQRYTVTNSAGPRQIDAPIARNAMFVDAMRDFLALVRGHAVSDVEHLPRLDLCLPSARLVARAWAARTFVGTINKELT